jgi:hypothetical protein
MAPKESRARGDRLPTVPVPVQGSTSGVAQTGLATIRSAESAAVCRNRAAWGCGLLGTAA